MRFAEILLTSFAIQPNLVEIFREFLLALHRNYADSIISNRNDS
jgi:hypothetical protein